MSRVIKFRVWYKDKMWPATIGDDGHVCIWRDDAEEIGNHCIGHCHESNDILKPVENLMQFTGLKDKNGVEIYEGDIMKSPEGFTREVIWYENDSGWRLKEKSGNVTMSFKGWIFQNEVIGNIFENKA